MPQEARSGGQADRLLRARRGRAYGFRFKDWTDYQALAQSIGVSDGTTTTFQLAKRCASGGVTENRIIAKLVAGTVKLCRDGVEATSGWKVDTTTGLVTFTTTPAANVHVSPLYDCQLSASMRRFELEVAVHAG